MTFLDKINARLQMDIRLIICIIGLIIPLLCLAVRLYQVQVLQGTQHTRDVSRQSVRSLRLSPVRGRIFSSDGQLLVGNRNVYDLVFHPAEMRQSKKVKSAVNYILENAERLALKIERESEINASSLKKHLSQRPALPLVIISNLDDAAMARLWEVTPAIPGMEVRPRLVRDYPYKGMLSQTLGFTANLRVDKEFEHTDFSRGYGSVDVIGRSGLELFYDKELSGHAGAKLLLVDPRGYVHKDLPGAFPPVNGYDLKLTIDSRAQRIGESVLDGNQGALVLMDVETGGVLAMVSKPGYDMAAMTAKYYRLLNDDTEHKPMLNRAVNAGYAPGSIVKPLVGMAALECGAIDTSWTHECIGYFMVGKHHRIHCAKRSGHGVLNLEDAITVSCNPFFMATGIRTTIDNLTPFFKAAGLGQKTGVDFQEIARGLCPSRQAAEDRYKRKWLVVDTAYCSMGQGLIEVTPLQMATYCAAIANGGKLMRPYLVEEIREQEGIVLQSAQPNVQKGNDHAAKVLRRTLPQVRNVLPVSPKNLMIIQDAMANAVEDDRGSGHLLHNLEISAHGNKQPANARLASKTGTAEIWKKGEKTKDTWMIVFGPLPKPRYAFACVVEHGVSGSKTVAPIALAFWKRWLETVGI